MRPLRILLLADGRKSHPSTVRDHIRGLQRHSRHDVRVFNPSGLRDAPGLDLDAFDAVVVHYTLVVTVDHYLSPWFRERLAAYEGLKIQFIQDEYRWVDEITATIRDLGVDVLYSVVQPEAVEAIYGARLPGVEVRTTLTGFVPEGDAPRRPVPLEDRPIDVGYRGRALPYWLGILAREKVLIGERFLPEARRRGLRCDIAWGEDDRLYGRAWERFLRSCRATLGTESGASIVDFDGTIEREARAFMAQRPAATFDDVYRAVLRPHDWKVAIRAISPRIFEAAAARTGLVLFPGEYSGVVRPGEHYVLLEKDMSNIDEVVTQVRDDRLLGEQIARTYEDVVASGRYSVAAFVEELDGLVAERAPARMRRAPRSTTLAAARLGRAVRRPPAKRIARRLSRAAAEARLLATVPEVRRLAVALARRPPRRRPTPSRVWGDLVRLALLVAARRGTLRYIGEPFTLDATVDPETGALTIASVPGGVVRELDSAREATLRSLRGGALGTAVWSHLAVGPSVCVPGLPGLPSHLPVGFHGLPGVHEFGALRELATYVPAEAAAVMDAVLGPGAAAAPTPQTPAARLLLDPGAYIPKTAVALSALVRRPALRALFLGYVRRPAGRAAVPLDGLVEDILKLELLGHALRESKVEASYDASRRTLVLRSLTADAGERQAAQALPAATAVDRVVWDHSRVGQTIEVPIAGRAMRVTMGRDGVYEFNALTALRRVLGPEVEDVVTRLGASLHEGAG